MRHRKRTAKLGRTSEHRQSLLANLVCSLIKERRITTTLAKAKAARPVAEKMVTLGKRGTLHDRRLAASRLRQEDACQILFKEIAPFFKGRNGGYTRIVRLHQRVGDAAKLAILEWIDAPAPEATDAVKTAEPKSSETKPAAVEEAKKPDESQAEEAKADTEPEKAEADKVEESQDSDKKS